MSDAEAKPAWFLEYAELERTLDRIREQNTQRLMSDTGPGADTPLLRPRENLARLCWYRELELQLARLVSGWISTAANFELKMELGRQAWLFTEVVDLLDARIAELPGKRRDEAAENGLRKLRQHLGRARDEEQLVIAVYHVVQAQLLVTLTEHIRQCDPLADWPTRDRLERAITIVHGQVAWAQAYVARYLERAERGEIQAWCKYAADALAAAGGTRGDAVSDWPAHPFADGELLDACAEPSRIQADWAAVTDEFMMGMPRVTEGALADVLFHNFAELIVPEGLGYMVYDVDGMPYGFYKDFIRQIWDECRHTQMGVRELERLGVDISKLPMNRLTRPPNYTAMLCVIGFTGEACSFPRKFQAVEGFYGLDCFEAGLVTEYDIVDEHYHVLNIRKWLPELHMREKIAVPLDEVIKGVQGDALERWGAARKSPIRNATRARQAIGRYGAFCREVDFELDFGRIFPDG